MLRIGSEFSIATEKAQFGSGAAAGQGGGAGAGQASSAVENWHSILRPHLAVHRMLSPGLLGLLAVWHSHRVFRRGVHTGTSPLRLSGILDAPTRAAAAMRAATPARAPIQSDSGAD